MLSRIVPENRKPSWGTMPSWEALPQQTRRTLTGLVTRLLERALEDEGQPDEEHLFVLAQAQADAT